MASDLEVRFERLEASKGFLLRSIASLDTATLKRKPDAATWSILQVIAHLTRSEEGTLQYIKKKTQDPAALSRAGLVAWVRVSALLIAFHSPFRFKAPKGLAEPSESEDLKAASLGWAEVREDWREFILGFPEALQGRLIFRHPFVGLLGPTQVMIFMDGHLGNHRRQVGRIRRALGI